MLSLSTQLLRKHSVSPLSSMLVEYEGSTVRRLFLRASCKMGPMLKPSQRWIWLAFPLITVWSGQYFHKNIESARNHCLLTSRVFGRPLHSLQIRSHPRFCFRWLYPQDTWSWGLWWRYSEMRLPRPAVRESGNFVENRSGNQVTTNQWMAWTLSSLRRPTYWLLWAEEEATGFPTLHTSFISQPEVTAPAFRKGTGKSSLRV